MEELEELFYQAIDQLSGQSLEENKDVQLDAVGSASVHVGQPSANEANIDNEAVVREILSALRQQ